MKNHNEAFEVIEELKNKICGVRHGMYYISNGLDPMVGTEDLTSEQVYSEGMCDGIYKGLEIALGLLEDVEEEWGEEVENDL